MRGAIGFHELATGEGPLRRFIAYPLLSVGWNGDTGHRRHATPAKWEGKTAPLRFDSMI